MIVVPENTFNQVIIGTNQSLQTNNEAIIQSVEDIKQVFAERPAILSDSIKEILSIPQKLSTMSEIAFQAGFNTEGMKGYEWA